MLLALMDGRALTATELAYCANITKQTASSHLNQLADAQLLAREKQGRHRYYRIADPDVAHLIEALLSFSEKGVGRRLHTGPREPALRKARICYDHLAGELGVLMYDQLTTNGWLQLADGDLTLTAGGRSALDAIGIEEDALLGGGRRPFCKTCLDWSERRHHLAGRLGSSLMDKIIEKKWARRIGGTRIISFTNQGEKRFRDWLRC